MNLKNKLDNSNSDHVIQSALPMIGFILQNMNVKQYLNMMIQQKLYASLNSKLRKFGNIYLDSLGNLKW